MALVIPPVTSFVGNARARLNEAKERQLQADAANYS